MIDSLGTDEEKSLTTQIALAPEKLITLASLVAPRLVRLEWDCWRSCDRERWIT